MSAERKGRADGSGVSSAAFVTDADLDPTIPAGYCHVCTKELEPVCP